MPLQSGQNDLLGALWIKGLPAGFLHLTLIKSESRVSAFRSFGQRWTTGGYPAAGRP